MRRRGAARCSAIRRGCSAAPISRSRARAGCGRWPISPAAAPIQAEARAALAAASRHVEHSQWPRPLRPLGMLAALARRDLARGPDRRERPGAPARMIRMLRHRLTGN